MKFLCPSIDARCDHEVQENVFFSNSCRCAKCGLQIENMARYLKHYVLFLYATLFFIFVNNNKLVHRCQHYLMPYAV